MSPKESIYKNFSKENLSQLILTLTNKLGKYYLENKEVTKEEFEKYVSNKVKANASGKDELIQLLNELDVLWVKSTEESMETIKKLRLEIEGLKQGGKDMSKGCSSKDVENPKGDMSEDTMGTQGGTPNSKMVPKEGKATEDTKSEYSEESVSTDSGSTVSGSTDTEVSIETEKVHGESFKMIKISQHVPTYKGTIDEDLDDWIFVVEASLGREVGVDGLNAITPLLKGRALSIFKNFRSENPHTGWLGFKKVLKQNFDLVVSLSHTPIGSLPALRLQGLHFQYLLGYQLHLDISLNPDYFLFHSTIYAQVPHRHNFSNCLDLVI